MDQGQPRQVHVLRPQHLRIRSAFVTAAIYRYVSPAKYAGKGYDAKEEAAWEPGWKLLRDLQPAMYNNGFHPNGNVAVLQLLAQQNIWMASVWSDMGWTSTSGANCPRACGSRRSPRRSSGTTRASRCPRGRRNS